MLSPDAIAAIVHLRKRGGEGDLNKWPRDVVVELLVNKLVRVFASTKPHTNLQLTRAGKRIGAKL